MKQLERRAAARADRLVCVSELDRDVLAREVAPGPFARATVLAAGVDAGTLLRRSSTPPDGAAMTRLLFLGRLEHQKNPELAVEVLERLVESADHGWTLTIAGDGGGARALDRRIAASPARDRIVRVGLVPHDQVAELIDAHGVLLVTSRYEASPTVVKDALLRQRPVVTTRAGDVARWIEPGNGTVRCHDAGDLAAGVRAMAELVGSGGWRAGDRLGPDAELRLMEPLIELYRSLHEPA
jgi:glycosyltransferase involved in cell wall biosynthesis